MNCILYNPLSNNGQGTQGLDAVIAAAERRHPGQTPRLVDVTKEDEAAVLLGLGPEDEAIVCGGDGTLHYLINALDGAVPAAAVYLWRMGTGNDFIRDLGAAGEEQMVPLSPYIRGLPRGETERGVRRFLNNVSFGLDGQVCELGEQEKQRLGRPINYVHLTVRLALRDFKPVNASVTVDGETRHYERVWVASAFNGRYVGGGVKLAPDQDRTGDELCCVVLHGMGRVMALLNMAKALQGEHVKMRQCDVRFGHEITVTADRPVALNMDGEPLGRFLTFPAVK